MISSAQVNRAGLTVEWFTQLDVRPGGKIVDTALVVNPDNSTTFFALEYGTQREVISQRDFDAFGKVMGIEGAQARAEVRKEILDDELAALGRKYEVKINRYTLPESTIYALTDTGLVNAIDGDTGRLKWSTRIGSSRLPSIGIGANHHYVAAINGIKVFCLDVTNGKILFAIDSKGIATSSPAVGGEEPKAEDGENGYVFVPLTNGLIEKFPIENNGTGSSFYKSVGTPTARPLVTEKTISWPTNKGHYNVVRRSTLSNGLSYRLRAYAPIISPANALGKIIYVASLDGFVYAIEEVQGTIVWEMSTGEQISQSPIPVHNEVYVITDANDLFRVDALTGVHTKGWEEPMAGIVNYVGRSESKLYVTDRLGHLVAIDLKSGQKVGQVLLSELDLILPNYLSDRLYVGYDSGMIQCLREIGKPMPHYHRNDLEPVAIDDKPKVDKEGKPIIDAEDDPFKAFDSKPKASVKPGEVDPFAPKKAGGAGTDDDPFAPKKDNSKGGDPFKK